MFKSSNFEKILFSSPSISPLKILRTHGYRNKEVIKKKILEAANKAIERLTSSSSPVGYFCIEEISNHFSSKIELKCGTSLNCGIFNERLAQSKFLIAFILTLGKEVDETIKKISNNSDEPLGALFLENASWLALELVLRDARSKIIKFAKYHDMQIENRMAPGYTYQSKIYRKRMMWELEEQKILFGLFDKESISIRLTESCTMLPRMSRSGIFGLKKNSFN
tara:strand:+ start:18 stop:686 length:669 start_codon:yes stop_codon:yes gene_type:complete